MRYEFITDGNYVNFFVGGALSCTLHKNSQTIDWLFGQDNGLAFTVNGGYYFTEDAGEIFFDGAPLTDNEDFVTAIQAMFPIYAGGTSPEAGLLKTATVELTDAQIKALPTTPFQLVAAQGAGKAIIPISCITIPNFTAGVYTHDADSSWQLAVSGGGISIGGPFMADTALSSNSNIYVSQIACIEQGPGAGAFTGVLVTGSIAVTSSYDNSALYIGDFYNGVNDYTGGNAANTLKITVYYVVIDL